MNEATIMATPAIGQLWPEQGGIFIGSRLIGGQIHHLIIPGGVEHDIKGITFNGIDEAITKAGEINGHNDWRAPDQEDLMLAWINAREHFVQTGIDSIYWSRSFHHDWPWAVVFECGDVLINNRNVEFRVRPFRSVIASSI